MNLKNAFTIVITLLALGAQPLAAGGLEKGEWLVRLILKSADGKLEDSYNMLGQRHDAAIGYDHYDLPELGQTWAGTYLSVIFYRPEWAARKDTYNTDFHPLTPSTNDEWTFEVRSDDPSRDLSLTWVGEQTGMKKMVLVDLQEDKVIPAVRKGTPQVYTFRMNGAVREFAWRVLSTAEYRQLLAAGKEAGKAKRKKVNRSNWLPKGWGQGEGKGHRRDSVADGLPEDPFGG